ncbi:hypothetical protein D3C78_1751640 [compost metagenome]
MGAGVGADPLAHLPGEDGDQLAVNCPSAVDFAPPPGLIKQAYQQTGGGPFELFHLAGQVVSFFLVQWAAQQTLDLGAGVDRQGGAEMPRFRL